VFLPDLVVRARRVVTDRGTRAAAIHIRDGRIIGVLDFDDIPQGCPLEDAGDAVVMPGVVDTHVHAGDRQGTGAGFETVTRAAASGGVTTIIDMPFPGPATTSVSALEDKRRAAAGRCYVDVGFWGGLVSDNVPDSAHANAPGNAHGLAALLEAGVLGFKCVLLPSNVDDFPAVSEAHLRIAMPALTRLGAILLVHAELPRPKGFRRYLGRRPKAPENEAIALLAQLGREYGTRTHVVHLSSYEALTPLYHARAARLPMTAETCPHYLYFVADEFRARHAVRTSPPIRERENREFLWAALANGLIQHVASDHVIRSGEARCGVPAIQLLLSATWTGASDRGYALEQLADWLCRAPSRLVGLTRKGQINVGYDADLVVFDPDADFAVQPTSTDPPTLPPYGGRRLRGVVERTYVRGREVYTRAGGWTSPPRGKLLD
jgi:allantoinase